MFARAARFLKSAKPLLAISALTLGLGIRKISLSTSPINMPEMEFPAELDASRMIRKIIQKDVCDSKAIREGQLHFIDVTEQPEDGSPPRTFKIAIGRVKGKLYAVLGHCTYEEPISSQTIQSNNFEDAIIFNDKLYCPHHGCAFDIRSGTVQYGPALQNLPRFFVEQKQGKVKLFYPARIPTRVIPKTQFRDLNDLRKVLIIGGDNNATMGVIHGLKLYDYGGQITVVQNDGQYSLPYRDDLIHRKLLNLNKNNLWKRFTNAQIEKELQQKVYSKLQFHEQLWYKAFGVDFVYNSEIFRVINKKYYPFVKFADSTKLQFDGIVYASGFIPKFPEIENISTELSPNTENPRVDLPSNVFAPYYNKLEHIRMLKFMNRHDLKNMIVLGLNVQSLQFVEAVKTEFPSINVKIIDVNKQNSLTQIYGPDVGQMITNQFTKRGVEMYIKISQIPKCTNSFADNQATALTPFPLSVHNSIQVQLDPNLTLSADCMVLFPNNTMGNTERIQTAKFIDIDFNKINGRIIVDPNSRTDTKRMFAAGSCSSLEFFFTLDRIQLINPNVAFEQGLTAGFNLNALNVPFAYIPFEAHKFFDKKILYAGARKPFNTMFILGNLKQWDFIAFYALQNQINAVSASPSRQKQFQVMRESFRLQCAPELDKIIKQQWTIALLYKLIRKLDKSGCYKDLIHTLDPQQNIAEVIWMQREKGSYVDNLKQDQEEINVEVDPRGYTTQT